MAGSAPGGWRAALQAAWAAPRPTLLARMLQPLSWLYAALAALHRSLYGLGLKRAERVPVPVVVVGNLVAGGAGKTPTVLAVVQVLRERGWHPGVVSRGYGAVVATPRLVRPESSATEVGDEPLLIHRRSGAPVAVAPRRVAAAHALCAAHPEVDVIVADDGLQHHALARDAQVLVFDERGVGNGLRLPAGPLRQAVPRAVPARSVVVYNADRATLAWPGFLARRVLAGIQPLAAWWLADPDVQPVSALRGRRVLAAAGLARPERFFAMLEAQGLEVDRLPLPDHHDFADRPWTADDRPIVVTEKDAVKLAPDDADAGRIWVARLDFQPEPGFGAALERLLPARRTS